MSTIRFSVPGKQVGVNATYRRGRGKRFYKTKEAVTWREVLQFHAKRAMGRLEPFKGPVAVDLWFYFDSEQPDIDGSIKPVLDGLQGIVYANDRQARQLHVIRDVNPGHPILMVQVTEISP
jgi:Holliday junction resolvase RusA-like endonuclease